MRKIKGKWASVNWMKADELPGPPVKLKDKLAGYVLNAMQDVGAAQKLKQIRYVDMGAQCDNFSKTFDSGLHSRTCGEAEKASASPQPRANGVRLLAAAEGNESVAVRHRHLR